MRNSNHCVSRRDVCSTRALCGDEERLSFSPLKSSRRLPENPVVGSVLLTLLPYSVLFLYGQSPLHKALDADRALKKASARVLDRYVCSVGHSGGSAGASSATHAEWAHLPAAMMRRICVRHSQRHRLVPLAALQVAVAGGHEAVLAGRLRAGRRVSAGAQVGSARAAALRRRSWACRPTRGTHRPP
eukprot:scaffold771_cov387-Prasinococcus_capsulatus_cf.AAC.7